MGGRWRRVGPSDSITSIAARHGLFAPTIWDHPKNDALRQQRDDPTALMEGDEVFVPDRQEKVERCAIDQTHRFRRKGIPARFELCLEIDDEVLSDTDYELRVGTTTRTGTTDGEGWLEEPIPATARRGSLYVPALDLTVSLSFGRLDPVDTPSGMAQRLQNLGYDLPGRSPEAIAAGLRAFQQAEALDVTGELDDRTRAALLEAHGEEA
ncbi:MAG: peptidoglycan-binding domain-containing protein [Sandaracinaceae bacterium]